MNNPYAGEERREFYRINYEKPLKFNEFVGTEISEPTAAVSKNVSQSGVLFQTKNPPSISNLLWISLDLRTLNICQEIEQNALIIKNGMVGKVIRLEESKTEENTYDVGVCFLKKDSKLEKKLGGLID
ncbi:MAG: PilZ domain-containing protein [Candidatus Omnitrophica bacterium]|nr:PilZ domain-containing protein [Candidatus Omnitrophota bacterium]